MDFGDEHPEAEVTGVDISPFQPNFVPINVRFIIDDIDEEWNYSEPFDYIHSRMMNFSFQDWTLYFRKIFDNLTPDGYVEVQEIGADITSDDGPLTEQHALYKWSRLLKDASVKLGRHFMAFEIMSECMADVGFTDMADRRFKWPTNRWPRDKRHKELAAWNNENSSVALESVTPAPFTRAHGWMREEVTVMLADVRKNLNDADIHAHWPICSIYGRKPEE